ncbi:MAG: hypothetical protein SGPRY_006476 [Prymnesium sp.]
MEKLLHILSRPSPSVLDWLISMRRAIQEGRGVGCVEADEVGREKAVACEQALPVRAEVGASPCEDDPAPLLSNGGEAERGGGAAAGPDEAGGLVSPPLEPSLLASASARLRNGIVRYLGK